MTIYQGSRYEYSVVDFISVMPDGNENPVVFYDLATPGIIAYKEYVWIEGDRLDSVSYNFYGQPGLWWLILDANPEIVDPKSIVPGTILRIPNA